MTPGATPDAKHIAFLLPDMGGGGAERLTLDLLEAFVDAGCQVDLLLQRREGVFLSMVPPQVRIVDLGAPRLRQTLGPLRRYLQDSRPAAVLAAMWPLTSVAIAAARGLSTRIVVADHCPLREQYAHFPQSLALRLSVLASYRFADGVVAVSNGLAGEIAGLAGITRSSTTVINNPVGPPLRSDANPDSLWRAPRGKRLLAVGKLKSEKRHDLLIDAVHRLNDPKVELAIVGDGELREPLEAQIARLGLEQQVRLPGFTTTPGDWYEGASLLALTSDYEGFGNVLVEAMHHGLPVISTDCAYGPTEILGGGRWGHLTPCGDADALARAMRATLDSPVDADAQRARAADFSIANAVDGYRKMLIRS